MTERALPWTPAPSPPDEDRRQQALDNYQILDTEAEQSFDDLTRLAEIICSKPMAALSLIDRDRQWFKSRIGLGVPGTPRDWSFCGHAILDPGKVFEVPDASEDARFAFNPLVQNDPHVRFYAGAPLITPQGMAVGALCVLDREPGKLTPKQSEALTCLARQAVAQMELHKSVLRLKEQSRKDAQRNAESLRLQAHLASSERRFRLLAEASGDIIMLLDVKGKFHYLSPAVKPVLGWQTHEISGIGYRELVHRDDLPSIERMFQQCLDGGTNRPAEFRCRNAGGAYTWLELNVRLYHEADTATPAGFVAVGRDVAQRKAVEVERVRAFAAIEQANEELKHSRAAALRANQAKSDFLSNMSHEIRTPMNAVLGMNQLLLQTILTAEQQHYVEVAQSGGRTLLALIDDILDLSKIEAGKLVIECLDFDLNHYVTETSEIWRLQAQAKGLTFRADMAPEVPSYVRGDPHRLRQVLNNLAANAIKFTEQGEVAISVNLVEANDQGVGVRFSVSDTGIGIRADQATTLFSPFVQADVSTTRNYGGTGLGLAICKNLVKMMGGDIGVESNASLGSTFWFTVTFEPSAMAALASREALPLGWRTRVRSVDEQPSTSAGPGHPVRILVAEDNQINRLVIRTQLEKLGHEADIVINGVEAVEAMAQRSYDLVLMDCEMPIMDGYDATRRIREADSSRVPIIAVTAHAMSGDRERCMLAGMDDFLSKPIDMHLLSQIIAKWC